MKALAFLLLLAEIKIFSVTVTKVQPDVYKFRGPEGLRRYTGVIVTNRCYRYAWEEGAIVRFEKDSRGNRILFSKDGSVCDVASVTLDPGSRLP